MSTGKHFRGLSIFHYILSGFWGLYVVTLIVSIFSILNKYSGNFSLYLAEISASACSPSWTGIECTIFTIFIFGFVLFMIAVLFISNLLAALSYQRKNISAFSWIAASLNLVFIFPITTILGIYSLYVLNHHLKISEKGNNQ